MLITRDAGCSKVTSDVATRILLTGANGRIGTVLAAALEGEHHLRLLDITLPRELVRIRRVEWVKADITEFGEVMEAAKDVDCVIHLAATPNARDWETVSRLNIQGARNVFEAAKRNGVPKIIFASSTHTVGMYDLADTLSDDMPYSPDSLYGVSKAFGEVYLKYLCTKHGLTGIALRIGSFLEAPEDARSLYTWISHQDLVRAVRACIATKKQGFHVVFGFSDNGRLKLRNTGSHKIGYKAVDQPEASRVAKRAALATTRLGGSWALQDR
jgi:uronate dehydrogenase